VSQETVDTTPDTGSNGEIERERIQRSWRIKNGTIFSVIAILDILAFCFGRYVIG
jgi:hypothetical protein